MQVARASAPRYQAVYLAPFSPFVSSSRSLSSTRRGRVAARSSVAKTARISRRWHRWQPSRNERDLEIGTFGTSRARVVAISSHPRESISSARPDDLFLVSSLARHVYTSLFPRALVRFPPFALSSPRSTLVLVSVLRFLRLGGRYYACTVLGSRVSYTYTCPCLYVCVCAPRALLRGCVGRVSSGESAGQNGRG